MTTKRQLKYIVGRGFDGMDDLGAWLQRGQWVFWGDRPKHPSIIWSMQYRTVAIAVASGLLRRALLREGIIAGVDFASGGRSAVVVMDASTGEVVSTYGI